MMAPPTLQPARPDPSGGEKPSYLPRFPWRWILTGALFVGVFGGGYWYRQREKEAAIRSQVLRAYARIDQGVGRRYRRLRSRIERLTMEEAARTELETYHDPHLRFAPLHRAKGLYLRIPMENAHSARTIADAASAMEPDAITRCLGILPESVRGLYQSGRVLMPEWRRDVETAEAEMRLRARDDELAGFMRQSLPAISTLLGQHDYFLLVLEEGASRHVAPVRITLWEMRSEPRLILRLRTEADGFVIPVRVRLAGAPPSPHAPNDTAASGAADCSIASAMKALTGEGTPDATTVIAGVANVADAGVVRDGGAPNDAAVVADGGR